jgi:tetratricopeptide (TPR) repeat protein
MGDAGKARACYEEAKALLDRFEDPNGNIFYHRGLGDLALVIHDFGEAERQFAESLKFALAAGHSWGMSYALTGLGRACSGSGNYARSRDYLKQALQRAKEADELGIALVALAGVADLLAATGEAEQAWDLATLVVNHHVSWRETKERAQAVLEALRGSLPVEPQVEFGEQAGTSNVWGEVDHLLSEL